MCLYIEHFWRYSHSLFLPIIYHICFLRTLFYKQSFANIWTALRRHPTPRLNMWTNLNDLRINNAFIKSKRPSRVIFHTLLVDSLLTVYCSFQVRNMIYNRSGFCFISRLTYLFIVFVFFHLNFMTFQWIFGEKVFCELDSVKYPMPIEFSLNWSISLELLETI